MVKGKKKSKRELAPFIKDVDLKNLKEGDTFKVHGIELFEYKKDLQSAIKKLDKQGMCVKLLDKGNPKHLIEFAYEVVKL